MSFEVARTALGQDLLNARAGFVAFRDGSVATDVGYYHAATDSAFSLASKQRVDKAGMAGAIASAARHLGYSDYILQHDMTRKLREARP